MSENSSQFRRWGQWGACHSVTASEFWGYDKDGDNIKEDLKKRFDNAATQLTDSERADVVDEAVRICGHAQ
jgi:hypothetical protein